MSFKMDFKNLIKMINFVNKQVMCNPTKPTANKKNRQSTD